MQHRSSGKWLVLVAACIAGGLSSSASLAGLKTNHFVSISGLTAQGALGSARNSTDQQQEIGCYTSKGDDVGPPGDPGNVGNTGEPRAKCFARNSAGTSLECATENAGFFAVISSISSTSWVQFTADASGQCTFVRASNDSRYTVPVH